MLNRILLFLLLAIIAATVGIEWRRSVLTERAVRISQNARVEKTITILPGWDLRDIAEYLVSQQFASSTNDVYAITGKPAIVSDKNLEGYLAPETYRVYADARLEEIIAIFSNQREKEFTEEIKKQMRQSGRTVHEIVTMASILEREVRNADDKAMVADIFWRRHDVGMGLQADSTVHYAAGTEGEVFTTAAERASDNAWNTYKYPRLPPGPISAPSMESIRAAMNPKENDYWYFLTTLDTGEVKYARTLAEHNTNARRFLKK